MAKRPDITRPNGELSATLAAMDQFEAEKRGEANPRPVRPAVQYTEKQLLRMTRAQLNRIASEDLGIERPEKLRNKRDVAAAMLAKLPDAGR